MGKSERPFLFLFQTYCPLPITCDPVSLEVLFEGFFQGLPHVLSEAFVAFQEFLPLRGYAGAAAGDAPYLSVKECEPSLASIA